MERIALIRNTYLRAYLCVLRSHGVDSAAMLERQQIPADFEYLTDYMLPAALLHQFIADAAACAAPGTISTAAGLYNAAHQPNPFSDTAWQAASLADAIHQHNDSVAGYSPENRFDLTIGDGNALWRKLGRSPSPETETFCVANLIGHVRSLLGDGWRPVRVQVSVAEPGALASLPLYRGVEISRAPRFAGIAIPLGDLSKHVNGGRLRSIRQMSATSLRAADLDFVESLCLLMKGYARIGGLNVDAVARAAGTSRRTLQRRLSAIGVSYAILADQVRFEVASDLLVQAPDLGVTQIGYELGYRDPGSFSRAFKRYAGVAPSAYRRRFADRPRSAA